MCDEQRKMSSSSLFRLSRAYVLGVFLPVTSSVNYTKSTREGFLDLKVVEYASCFGTHIVQVSMELALDNS